MVLVLRIRFAACMAVLLLVGLIPAVAAAEPAVIEHPELTEVSGVAPSQRQAGLFWLHNDSGDRARLIAVDAAGRARAELGLRGVVAVDWEDLAACRLDGEPYLVVADVGDNRGVRTDCQLHVVAEPELPATGAVPLQLEQAPAWSLPVVLPEGPADIEAVAVDGEEVLLLTKRLGRNRLYVLPLRPAGATPPARLLGTLAPAAPRLQVEGTSLAAARRLAEDLAPTAMDVHGDLLAVSTYHSVWLVRRDADGGWLDAQDELIQLPAPAAPQIEACCFTGPRGLLLVSEGAHPRLLRMDWDGHGH